MNKYFSVITILLALFGSNLVFSGAVYAYGSSAQRPVCKKPVVKVVSPKPESGATAVAAGSEFVFEVSSDAKKKAITMSAKDIAIPVEVTMLSNGKYQVTGNLPESLTEGYASVVLTAPDTSGKCVGEAKVLVKIN